MENKSHLTAISRNKPSQPMQWLSEKGLIDGLALDYGCGKGFDADYYAMDKLDPHFTEGRIVLVKDKTTTVTKYSYGAYDTITCNYVLNVIESQEERDAVLKEIQFMLCESGKAYITVRRDKDVVEGYTSRGTYQSAVELDLPVVKEVKGKYIIYLLEK